MTTSRVPGQLPFSIVSSSVSSSGYVSLLRDAGIPTADVTDLHRDIIGSYENEPMNGPFTEQHVGGNQHRHAHLNDGTDIKTNRAEAFVIEPSGGVLNVFGPDAKSIPPALYTRDETVKRPLNIRNISLSGNVIGNYQHDYEVVQSVGARQNPRYFVEVEGAIQATSEVPYFTGNLDYNLTDRSLTGTNKSIFTSRFNSPGDKDVSSRGVLDTLGEEMAVHNNLNFRNLAVRRPHNLNLQAHMSKSNGLSGSIHGVHRNSSYRTGSDDTGVVVKYDNFFVQHAIPQSDLQYSWITSSTTTDKAELMGYQRSGSVNNKGGAYTDIEFVTSSDVGNDFIGISGTHKEADLVLTASNTWVRNATGSSGELLEGVYSVFNGPYQHSSWKQLRNREHPVVTAMHKENIVSIEDKPLPITFGESGRRTTVKAKHAPTSTKYIDPPVVSKHKPMKHRVILKGNSNPLLGHEIKHTYGNNLQYFGNERLTKRLGVDNDDEQVYDKLLNYYSNPNYPENLNPIEKLLDIKYSEVVYPKSDNTYLARTRGRTRYILNEPGTGSDGYDKLYGTQRAFWRDNQADRLRTPNVARNSQNAILGLQLTQSNGFEIEPFAYYESSFHAIFNYSYLGKPPKYYTSSYGGLSFKPIDSHSSSYVLTADMNAYYPENDPDFWDTTTRQFAHQVTASLFSSVNAGELNNRRVLLRSTTMSGTVPLTGAYGGSNNILTGTIRFTVLDDYEQFQYLFKTDDQSATKYQTHVSESYQPCTKYCAWLTSYDNGMFFAPAYEHTHDSGLRYDVYSQSGKRPFFDSYEEFSTDISKIGKEMSTLSEFTISDKMDYFIKEKGGNFRKNTKDVYSLNGAGHSGSIDENNFNQNFYEQRIITEKIKNLEDIKKDNENNSKESIITIRCQGIKKMLPHNGFYPIERTVQLASLLSSSYQKAILGGTIAGGSAWTNFSEGAHRALLQPFFAPGIMYNTIKSGIAVDFPIYTGSILILTRNSAFPYATACDIDAQLASFGFYSIMNAIENRFVLDGGGNSQYFPREPGYSSQHLIVPFTSSFTYAWNQTPFMSSASYRIPFEAIIDPRIGLIFSDIETDAQRISPAKRKEKFFISYGFPIADGLQTTSWFEYRGGEDPRYSMAANNFFAETINFFLPDSKLSSFTSKKNSDWKILDENKTYYMDVVLGKTNDLVLMESYTTAAHPTGALGEKMNGRYFGWPYSIEGTDYPTGRNPGCYNDPAYAAFTPSYFEGLSRTTLYFSPYDGSRKYSLDEVFSHLSQSNTLSGLTSSFYAESAVSASAMLLEASVNLIGKYAKPSVTYDANSQNANLITTNVDSANEQWVIYPKMETPILDFSNQQFVEDNALYEISSGTISGSGFGRGMWSGYGTYPENEKGLFISLQETFATARERESNISSLIEAVGFESNSKRKLGQVAQAKEISEAVVMIPYLESKVHNRTTEIDDGYHFITIPQSMFNLQKKNIAKGEAAIKTGDFGSTKDITETSISKMIQTMPNYVIPPNYNFLGFDDIKPFAMYIMEFKHTLDRQDLTDIWQGVMPKIAETAEKDQVTIEHPVNGYEFFGEKGMPEGIKWLVFKIKKKAATNYFKKTLDSTDDDRFQFDFQVGRKEPEYSYNWPYDFFSLVELAKCEVEVTLKNKEDEIINPTDGSVKEFKEPSERKRKAPEQRPRTKSKFGR